MLPPAHSTLNRPTSDFNLRCLRAALILLASALMFRCGTHGPSPQEVARSCEDLSVRMIAAERTFLDRAKNIRYQHLLLQDYDRQMIAALTARRNEIQSTSLMEMSVSDEIAGCSGKPLETLRWQAREEMSSLQSFLSEFQRALRSDPDGVFIDRP